MKKIKKRLAVCAAAVLLSGIPAAAQKVLPKENIVPGYNAFTGNTKVLDFEDGSALEYFRNTQWGDDKDMFAYDIADCADVSDFGKALRITFDTEKYSAKYDSSVYVYHNIQTDFEQPLTRPGLLVYDTYGAGSIGFWLNGSKHVGLGTLSKPAASKHVAVNNSAVYPDSLSSLNIQYAVNGGCANIQYIDNLAFIPYYKAEYAVKYPDGTSADSVIKYFLCSAGSVKVQSGGTLSGLPTEYVPESIELSFPKYELVGWSEQENAKTPSDKIKLENRDITLYPVWSKKSVLDEFALNIYFDAEKTQSKAYTLTEGDAFVFPKRSEAQAYVPDGKFLVGFKMDGKLYSPGAKTYISGEKSVYEAIAEYMSLTDEKYGELVFYEDFELFEENTDMASAGASVSYINPSYSENSSVFKFGRGDYANRMYIGSDGGGNRALVIRQTDNGQRWPQFKILNNGTAPEGEYTIKAEFMVPASQKSYISSPSVRFCGSSSYLTAGGTISSDDIGKYVSVSVSANVGADFENTNIKLFQIYATANSSGGDAYFYVDNVALYRKSGKCEVKFDGADSTVKYFSAGEKLKLPERSEVYEKIPSGYVLAGFKKDGKTYEPGEEYQNSKNDSSLVFEAVYEKASYNLAFRLGSANGTVGEITVYDGQKAVLPKDGFGGADKLSGWRIAGTETVIAPGAEYTFEYSKAKGLLDGTSRLVFEAVYSEKIGDTVKFDRNFKFDESLFDGASDSDKKYLTPAYEYGILPADSVFDGKEKVSLSEILSAAERLYYRSRGEKSYFASDAERSADMKEKSVCDISGNFGAEADFAVLGTVLANVLPDESYAEMCFDVTIKGITSADAGFSEALKLVRAGILPESTDFSAKITRLDFVKAIAKLAEPSLRKTEEKRRLYILGDSLTVETVGAGWPKRLEFGDNFELVNLGIGGIDTSTYFYTAGTAYALYKNMLSEINPGDYVAIALGTNDSTLWGRGTMSYETSRDNYYRYIKEIRAEGGIPFLVCPIGRNSVDENGAYIESDPKIIECMNDVNSVYGACVPIINFKSVSFERFGAMTAEQRSKIYSDSVHYTPYGAAVAAEYFTELANASKDTSMTAFKNYFASNALDFFGKNNVLAFDLPETKDGASAADDTPSGIRFSAEIGLLSRKIAEDAAEYGFIVARASVLGETELTHKSGVPFAFGRAYGNMTGEDIRNGASEDGLKILLSARLVGFPDTKEAYTAELAVRGYVKIGVSYFYGSTVRISAYEAAKRSSGEYAEHIIEICEK